MIAKHLQFDFPEINTTSAGLHLSQKETIIFQSQFSRWYVGSGRAMTNRNLE